jgi:hypothetical protein
MTLLELNTHIQTILKEGVIDPNLHVKFRGDGGKHYDIDYSVMSNDYKTIFLAEEYF